MRPPPRARIVEADGDRHHGVTHMFGGSDVYSSLELARLRYEQLQASAERERLLRAARGHTELPEDRAQVITDTRKGVNHRWNWVRRNRARTWHRPANAPGCVPPVTSP
jgi:hypothetical protein